MDIIKAIESLNKAYIDSVRVVFYSDGSGHTELAIFGEHEVLDRFDSFQEFIDLIGNKIISQS